MIHPSSESLDEQMEALRLTAYALADGLKHNANVFRQNANLVNLNNLAPRMIELHLGDACPPRPKQVDQFSALVGAATILALSVNKNNSIDWIMNDGK